MNNTVAIVFAIVAYFGSIALAMLIGAGIVILECRKNGYDITRIFEPEEDEAVEEEDAEDGTREDKEVKKPDEEDREENE